MGMIVNRRVSEDILISDIYDSALNPESWQRALRILGEATDSVSAGLALNRRGYGQVEASYNVDPHYNDLYRDHYSGICPLTPLAFQQAPGLRRGWSVTQSADYKASEYFNDWARPQGWMEIVGVDLVRNATNVGGLALWRSAGALELSPEAMDLLRRVTPHLRRAFSIRTALDQAACAEETMKRAVQAAGFALVLLAADGKVAFANERAETLLRRQSGLYGAHGRIDLSGVSPAALAGGATFNISRGAGESPLAVHILPLRKGQADRIGVGSPIAAMFILDPSADFEARAAEFGRRFNLTTAETRLLARVARGEGLLATARGLGVTEHTARTHLNRIFSKTDTTRQADLVRQFLQTTLPI